MKFSTIALISFPCLTLAQDINPATTELDLENINFAQYEEAAKFFREDSAQAQGGGLDAQATQTKASASPASAAATSAATHASAIVTSAASAAATVSAAATTNHNLVSETNVQASSVAATNSWDQPITIVTSVSDGQTFQSTVWWTPTQSVWWTPSTGLSSGTTESNSNSGSTSHTGSASKSVSVSDVIIKSTITFSSGSIQATITTSFTSQVATTHAVKNQTNGAIGMHAAHSENYKVIVAAMAGLVGAALVL